MTCFKARNLKGNLVIIGLKHIILQMRTYNSKRLWDLLTINHKITARTFEAVFVLDSIAFLDDSESVMEAVSPSGGHSRPFGSGIWELFRMLTLFPELNLR